MAKCTFDPGRAEILKIEDVVIIDREAPGNVEPSSMESRLSMDGVVTRVVVRRWKRFPLQSERCPFELRLGDEVRISTNPRGYEVRGFSSAGVFVHGLRLAQPWYSVSFVRGG